MQTEYRGHTIFFSETREEWSIDKKDMEYRNKSLAAVKKYIDNFYKKKVKDVRVYKWGWHGEIKTVWVTSVNEHGEVWIRDTNGNRQKEYRKSELFAYADANNRKVVPELRKLNKRREAIEKQIEQLRKKLTPFDIKKYMQKQEDKADGKAKDSTAQSDA